MNVDPALRASPLHRDDLTVLGPYRLVGRLGAGGMGVVYLGQDSDDRLVAIKLVHAQLADNPEFRARFRSEVERARAVPSFCTAEVLDADLDHRPPYLVVEYVDGPSLAEVVRTRGPLTVANLHSVAVGVATALVGIHGAGVIHRDLKPENVLLAPGSPKVIDFGIARAFEVTSEYTRTGQMVGTVSYMAPERITARPGTPMSPAADVFAWGCVVAYAGTGQTPFHGDGPEATAARILTQPPYLDGLAEPLRRLVELAVVKDPADRPTARELLDMLVSGPGLGVPRPRPTSGGLPPAVAAFLHPVDEHTPSRSHPAPSRSPHPAPSHSPHPAPSRSPHPAPSLSHPAPSLSHPTSPVSSHPTSAGSPNPGGSQQSPARSQAGVARSQSGPARSRAAEGRPAMSEFVDAVPEAPASSPPGPVLVSNPLPMYARRRPAAPKRTPMLTRLTGPGRWRSLSTLLVVAGIVAVISAGVWAGRSLNSPGPDAGRATPHTLEALGDGSTPAAPPSTAEPTGGTVDEQDRLDQPRLFTAGHDGGGSCRFSDGLRAERADRVERGAFQCPGGPAQVLTGTFGVQVTATLQSAGSCAGLWFHWSPGNAGQVLEICGDGISLVAQNPAADRVAGTYSQAKPIGLRASTRINLVVRDGSAAVWQDGAYAGSVALPSTDPGAGQVKLGITVADTDAPPVYAVTFTGLEIRSW